MKEIKIGLIGFGTVGTGVVRVLQENAPLIEQRLGGRIRLHRIADIDLARHREVQVPQEILTTDAEAVLSDPEIAICVELVGGIEPARTFILKAMQSGKHVVTANKALLALHGAEIFAAAQAHGVRIGFEARAGGGLPIRTWRGRIPPINSPSWPPWPSGSGWTSTTSLSRGYRPSPPSISSIARSSAIVSSCSPSGKGMGKRLSW